MLGALTVLRTSISQIKSSLHAGWIILTFSFTSSFFSFSTSPQLNLVATEHWTGGRVFFRKGGQISCNCFIVVEASVFVVDLQLLWLLLLLLLLLLMLLLLLLLLSLLAVLCTFNKRANYSLFRNIYCSVKQISLMVYQGYIFFFCNSPPERKKMKH